MLEKHGRRFRESDRNEEWQMLAADCVADLFRRDPQGRYVQFRRFFKRALEESAVAEEIESLLRELVCNKVRQRLIILFRQRDPVGRKIWRNLMIALSSRPDVRVRKDLTGHYLLCRPPDSSIEAGVVTIDFLELQEKRRTILAALRQKLSDGYVHKKKLTPQQATFIHLALGDLLDDMLAGEMPGKYFCYLHNYWRELSQKEYVQSVHKIFEYLILQMKKMVRSQYEKIF